MEDWFMKQTINGYVKNLVYGIDDEYLIVEVQVSKFKRGDKVKVTVESR